MNLTGPGLRGSLSSLLGNGVFAADGETWKFHRTMARPFFSNDRVSHFDIFHAAFEDLVSKVVARVDEGYPIDMQDAASKFTLDSGTAFLFGHNVGSLASELPYPERALRPRAEHPVDAYTSSFLEAQRLTALRSRIGWLWPVKEIRSDAVKAHADVVRRYIEPVVDQAVRSHTEKEKHVNAPPSSLKQAEEDETLLDYLVKFTTDRQVLLDQIVNMLIASRDTTANLITFAVYLLAEHPEVRARLRREIHEQVGDRRPTFEDIRGMRFLRAVLNETLRLYPAVPLNSKTAKTPVIWRSLDGEKSYYIPAHVKVLYSVFWLHRRKDLWGDDAHRFDPDRFIDDRVKRLTKNPWMFLPFNGGPRICLGQQFAYNEASFFIIRLLQKFSDIKLNMAAAPTDSLRPDSWFKNPRAGDGTERVNPSFHLTMYSKGGMWVDLVEADD